MDWIIFGFGTIFMTVCFLIIPIYDSFGQKPEEGTNPKKGDYRIIPFKDENAQSLIYYSQKFDGSRWKNLTGYGKSREDKAREEILFDKSTLPNVTYISGSSK